MKMKLFQRLLFVSLVLLAFSCKKNDPANPESDSYVKVKMNGNWITFEGLGELGPDLLNSTKTDLGVSGTNADRNQVFNIAIQLDGTSIPPGVYKSDDASCQMSISFMIMPTPSDLKNYQIDDALSTAPSKYVVNITSITSTEITGTFSGNYLYSSFNSDEADGGILKITEGEFKVRRIR